MTDFYAEIQETASEVLAEFRQGEVTLVRITEGVVDPAQPQVVPAPVTKTYPLDATVSGVSDELVNGADILSSDLEVVAAVPPVEPALTDLIRIDGKPLTIVRVLRIPASGTAVAYRLIVRG